jgi:barstar (barnase inhibitor)
MPKVIIDTTAIHDWDTLHAVCKEAFGFPDFYGRNGDAFIDCLNYLDEGDSMSRFVLKPGETLTVEITDAYAFADRAPEQALALLAWIGAANEHHVEDGKAPMLLMLPR